MSGDDNNPEGTPPPAGDGEEWTPPTREEWEKAQRTAEVRKRERDEARREAAAAREAAGKAKPADDDAAEKKVAAAQEASDNRARRAAGITALVEAGLTRAQAKAALPLVKLDKLTVDQDGDVDEEELEEAVKSLRKDFPGMFPDGKKAPRAHTADGGGRDGATKTPTDRTTDRMMRQAGLVR